MKAIILGGTRGMGRATARLLAEEGAELFLLGRNIEDLERSAQDLQQRSGGQRTIGTALCDLEQPDTFSDALKTANEALGGVDTVIVTAGLFGSQLELEEDLEFARRLLTVNFANTVIFCEHAKAHLLKNGGGSLVVFSSVAGDRGRKPVILYGSSKAGLSAYLEGLDHKYRAEGLNTICIKPGFVRTGMTEGLTAPPFAGEPEGVARQVVQAIKKGTPVLYTPRMWGLVMLVIRNLPRFIMRKIGF